MPAMTSPTGPRVALYVDVENAFHSLNGTEPRLANRFVQRAERWLTRLSAILGDPRWIVRRAYVSGATRRHLRVLASAGLRPVDCPTLTHGAKNAADMHIAVDVLRELHEGTGIDVVVLVTADTDFVPVMHEIQRKGIRVVAVPLGKCSPAYRNVADVVLTSADLGLSAETAAKVPGAELLPEAEAAPTRRTIDANPLSAALSHALKPLGKFPVGHPDPRQALAIVVEQWPTETLWTTAAKTMRHVAHDSGLDVGLSGFTTTIRAITAGGVELGTVIAAKDAYLAMLRGIESAEPGRQVDHERLASAFDLPDIGLISAA